MSSRVDLFLCNNDCVDRKQKISRTITQLLTRIEFSGTTRCSSPTTRYVDETDLRSLLAEATSAEHQIVLSNQTTAVTAGTASELDEPQ